MTDPRDPELDDELTPTDPDAGDVQTEPNPAGAEPQADNAAEEQTVDATSPDGGPD